MSQDWFDRFKEEPPEGHLQKVLKATQPALDGNRVFINRTSSRRWFMMLGAASTAALSVFLIFKTRKSEPSNQDDLLFLTAEAEGIDIDLLADLPDLEIEPSEVSTDSALEDDLDIIEEGWEES